MSEEKQDFNEAMSPGLRFITHGLHLLIVQPLTLLFTFLVIRPVKAVASHPEWEEPMIRSLRVITGIVLSYVITVTVTLLVCFCIHMGQPIPKRAAVSLITIFTTYTVAQGIALSFIGYWKSQRKANDQKHKGKVPEDLESGIFHDRQPANQESSTQTQSCIAEEVCRNTPWSPASLPAALTIHIPPSHQKQPAKSHSAPASPMSTSSAIIELYLEPTFTSPVVNRPTTLP